VSSWIAADLRRKALERSQSYPDESFTLRGLWKLDLLYKPSIMERLFSYVVVLSQCLGQGCCYTEENPVLDKNLVGKDARQIVSESESIKLSVLDAIYSVLIGKPAKSHYITGASFQKSRKRARIVASEVVSLLEESKLKHDYPRVLNIGAVGSFVAEFRQRGFEISVTDKSKDEIGRTLSGVKVESHRQNRRLIEESDVAVVTGMTLSTGTLERIVEDSRKHHTKLVMFAETGANFAQEYCNYGIDVVVSEPFPFYIFSGPSTIRIYRKTRGH
jgi:hypothetical protein